MTIAHKNKRKDWGREFIYPKKPKGKLYNWRKWVSYMLLGCLFSFPFIKFRDEQLVLLNFLERKFVFFGVIFTPQDFFLFALAMLIFMVFIVAFTVVLGRLWCGWACPQTVFMEMVFRRIEYWIEGDTNQQQKLDAQPWTTEKIVKKTIKHTLFLLISFGISNVFLAYIIGSKVLFKIVTEPLADHLSGLLSILLFTLIFYLVFAYVREVVCTVICPYGRLQSVLLHNDSLVVAYNEKRGEPRAHLQRKNANIAKGDCIDCGLCVQVCPTGIDIRNGTQLECINCTACIDSCNQVMLKINQPQNLIGFYTQDYINKQTPFKLGLKAYGYMLVLMAAVLVFSSMIYKRQDVETTILRASGTLFQQNEDGTISNLYNAELVNKTNKDIRFVIVPKNKNDRIKEVQTHGILPKEGAVSVTFFLIKDAKNINGFKENVALEVWSRGKLISTAETSFFSKPN